MDSLSKQTTEGKRVQDATTGRKQPAQTIQLNLLGPVYYTKRDKEEAHSFT